MPGVYAQRLYARTHTSGRTKSVQDAPTTNDHGCTDAESTKHTQPFTEGKGFGVRDREISLFFKKTDFFYKLKPRFLHRGFMFLYNYIFSAILSPISEQDSFVIPSLIISPVRKPSFSTLLTAFSTASASFTISKL